MTHSEKQFLHILEKRAKEQASIEASSPLPHILRPFAAVVGQEAWKALLLLSLIVAICMSVGTFRWVYRLYERGVLQWLVGR